MQVQILPGLYLIFLATKLDNCMETLELKPGDPIYEADGPPRYVLADILDGKRAIMLRVNNPDECYTDLMAHATIMQRLRRSLANRKGRR